MATSKGKGSTTATAANAPAVASFWHPTPQQMESAGFRLKGINVWSWLHDGPTKEERWHITVSLLPKYGEIFVIHSKPWLNASPEQYGPVAPLRTSVTTFQLFEAVLVRYGWKMPTAARKQA